MLSLILVASQAVPTFVWYDRGAFRSEARYIVSEDADLTLGVGWVTSMAGIMKFSRVFPEP